MTSEAESTDAASASSYYVLECFTPLDADPADLAELPEVDGVDSWMDGALITVPVPEPLEFALDPDEPGPLKEMYNLELLVMSERLVESLRKAGVDNLQVYRATIHDPANGSRRHDYRVVNIVGCVAAADMNRSLWSSPTGSPMVDVDFDRLVVDAGRAGELLLFRLAECVSAIVVHARVREALLAEGFASLTFMNPLDYVG
jgi:hypothetical protein